MHGLVVFSPLRWDFVCQRPQHLLSRPAHDRRVFLERVFGLALSLSHTAQTAQEAGPTIAASNATFLPFLI